MEDIRNYIEAGIRTNEIEGFVFTDKEKNFLEKLINGIDEESTDNLIRILKKIRKNMSN